MKQTFLIVWLLTPLAALAWHYGPGQTQLAHETTADFVNRAEAAAAKEDWQAAVAMYEHALDTIAAEADLKARDASIGDERRIRLAQAHARIQAGDMVDGQEQLQKLLDEVEEAGNDPVLLTSIRNELATASYYAAWIMRLEGATELEWLPEAERSRQQFRLLAEHAQDAEAKPFLENLEAVVRLEQMDLSTLKAKPIPKQCPKCKKNLSQRKRKQCQSRCNSDGKKQKDGKPKKPDEKDARKEIKKTNKAGINQRKGTGS